MGLNLMAEERPSHPNDFNHTFQWLAELTGKAGRVVPSST